MTHANGLQGSAFNPDKDGGLGLPTAAQRAAVLQTMAEKNVKTIGEM